MPPAEVDIDADLVRSLVRDQRPDLAHLPVEPLASGWDNVSFRVGADLVARLPRRALAAGLVDHEVRWLPELAPRLPIPVPMPVFSGEPGHGFPFRWTLVSWIPGESAARVSIEERQVAPALADFLVALHIPAPDDAPDNPFRAVSLRDRDESVREWIVKLVGVIDVDRVTKNWDDVLTMPPPVGLPRWIHGDLHPHNLLVVNGRLSGVIDFGDLCAGDPATDLAIAWILFTKRGRMLFRQGYGGDDMLWRRAHGWALLFCLGYLANSADNETIRRLGQIGLRRVLEDD